MYPLRKYWFCTLHRSNGSPILPIFTTKSSLARYSSSFLFVTKSSISSIKIPNESFQLAAKFSLQLLLIFISCLCILIVQWFQRRVCHSELLLFLQHYRFAVFHQGLNGSFSSCGEQFFPKTFNFCPFIGIPTTCLASSIKVSIESFRIVEEFLIEFSLNFMFA